jgi:hypothetical protein
LTHGLRIFSPWFGDLTETQCVMVGNTEWISTAHPKVARSRGGGDQKAASQYTLQEHVPNDLTSSHQAPPPKVSTAS